MEKSFVSEWAKKVNWEKRVKAVCKPCWEIKYCPYGPLVENFPLKEEPDEQSCRIFGHDCPVFHVSEPFTETKDLRRITRAIPRTIQFKVLKRENQICSVCGNPVNVDDIEFDHIIPWSKGGPTEEHNITLLCSRCNKKKSNRFENDYLISDFAEHFSEPYDIHIVNFVRMTIDFGHDFLAETGKYPEPQDYADRLNNGELSMPEKQASIIYRDLTDFFNHPKPKDLAVNDFNLIKYRWGYMDGCMHTLKETCDKYEVDINHAVSLDRYLLNRLGFRVKNDRSTINRWAKL